MSAIKLVAGRLKLACLLLFGALLLTISPFGLAQEPADNSNGLPGQLQEFQTGVWLVTYGPGEIYWQRFGHNGIWIRDADLGLDHIFNFGFFDFEQENFFLRFLQGRMLYFSAAQTAQSEFAQYINENRSIRLQKLALSEEQALRLADYLVREVQPENRDYLYDYYYNNCSTRVRDALDFALDGQLHEQYADEAAVQNLRIHTRRLTAGNFWLYLGLELGLARSVDQNISRWDEFFIPAELADGITHLQSVDSLLEEDVLLYQSTLQPPPDNAPMRWPIYLAVALLILALLAWLCRRYRPNGGATLARTWLFFAGLMGGALMFFWFGTDHAVAAANFNLLLFSPLFLLVLLRKSTRLVAWLVVFSGILALLQSLWPSPPGQYTADAVAALLPFNLCAAWVLLQVRSRPENDQSPN
ncbi:MAG: DUF4105 domain-containing protein [Xanthomonadales bacterium]|nr:DUF4105 domain-containing protein [Xanthomonadales bacterium]